MSLELVPIRLDQLEQTRTLWLPFLEKIAGRQRCFIEQRLADVYSGDVGLFLVWDKKASVNGIVGYSIVLRGHQRFAEIAWVSGRLADFRALYNSLEEMFRRAGFAGMSANGRPGWGRYLKGWGYRLSHIQYEKTF